MASNYLYNLPNSTSSLDNVITETVAEVPELSTLLFSFVFFIVFLGGISLQKRRMGTSDYPMWSVVASLSTFLLALIMSVIEGLIRLDTLIIVTVVTIFSAVWLFLDRKQSEV